MRECHAAPRLPPCPAPLQPSLARLAHSAAHAARPLSSCYSTPAVHIHPSPWPAREAPGGLSHWPAEGPRCTDTTLLRQAPQGHSATCGSLFAFTRSDGRASNRYSCECQTWRPRRKNRLKRVIKPSHTFTLSPLRLCGEGRV